MFSIQDEVECYIACINEGNLLPLIGTSMILALLMFSIYFRTSRPVTRLSAFVAGQLFIISAIAAVVYAMKCSQMLSIEIYLGYVTLSTAIILLLPRVYYKILIKRYDARPITEVMDWPQEFVKNLDTKSSVYYYDSAVPRAFASGKAIFLSLGMLELVDETELKAVLAHEVWHLRHNSRTPILRQLSLMSFTKNRSEDELETLADMFAEKVVSKSALESARAKIS
ncbi:M48 family metalloprotease [Methanolobus sediminis]|uniref:M48 family metalloprotease n=1 Tax=Methanolobus sediminis TaxID=3072978 RepID=A0AA51YJL1_9EURY|nr:M48 family metalloprotease [Methanolobus sediminis]WMW25706.1 M48 family metalloprotease [Methanolobus sediminis]